MHQPGLATDTAKAHVANAHTNIAFSVTHQQDLIPTSLIKIDIATH